MLSMANFEKNQLNLKLTVDLDEQLTWAELLRFVDLARPLVDLSSTVGIEYDQDSMKPEALYVYLPEDRLPAEDGGSGV